MIELTGGAGSNGDEAISAGERNSSIGQHIRRRRLQLHLFQADLAKLFGVDIASVRNW